MNPHDPCVSNRMVNGFQQSILFHVDYRKLSHKDKKVNYSFILVLNEERQSNFKYGSVTMQVNRGKFHKYIGTT